MLDLINKKVLITTQGWFVAPDGLQYRACWGTLKSIHETGKSLGFIPNRAHANWFIEVGKMIIMGCQVMYVIECADPPNTNRVKEKTTATEATKENERDTMIYLTE